MKLITRSNHIKYHVPVQDIAIVSPQVNQKNTDDLNFKPPQMPEANTSEKSGHFLKLNVQTPANCGKSFKDKSITTRINSKNIYDSVKNPMAHSNLTDWKILTLRQIRKKCNPSSGKERQKSSNRSHGISVSISKQKNSSKSTQKQKEQPKVNKFNSNQQVPYFKYLSSLNKKGQLLDRLEYHFDKKQQGAHFC